ncbi:MAG: MraY family glycosyltransferase [Rubrivivax sp.]|jgi:Fuc2NAc and GlcNAc transferase
MTALHNSFIGWGILAFSVFSVAWFLTGVLRRYALRADMLDRPNDRSSHSVPTPRGGGAAIVVTFLTGTSALVLTDILSHSLGIALLAGGATVALLGYVDDRRSVPARYRFSGHLAAATLLLLCMEPLPEVPMFGFSFELGWIGSALVLVFITWSINLFNFMDGIDGIASVEAITVGLGGALLWALTGTSSNWMAPALVASATAGFLIWNFPPARIFMGDTGSGFLGLMIAAFALWAGTERPSLFWAWLILYGCFMVDATLTLVRRVSRGEKFHVAHRSHAYQYASRRLGSHRRVTLAIGAINVLWLLPIAALVTLGFLDGLVGLSIGYVPLIGLALHFKAGDRQSQESG